MAHVEYKDTIIGLLDDETVQLHCMAAPLLYNAEQRGCHHVEYILYLTYTYNPGPRLAKVNQF